MTSFVIPISDMEYSICFYYSKRKSFDDPHQCADKKRFTYGFLIAFAPICLRMIQCAK